MTLWVVVAVIVIAVPLALAALALALPCDGCRLRRERIARAVEKLREAESESPKTGP